MDDLYFRYIQKGRMELDDVPVAWRLRVENLLKEAEYHAD